MTLVSQANAQPTAHSSSLLGVDLTIPLGVLFLLTLGGVGYLSVQIKKLKAELEEEKQRQGIMQQKMEYQALYDALTQLPNRRLFRDRLLESIKLYSRTKSRFGVMMADLDHFKEINDTLGHDAGDMLLVTVTQRLRKAIRESDTLARLGGDEFAFICPSVQDMPSASVVCLRLIEVMKEPVLIKGHAYQVGISLGVALYPDHASDDEMLIRRADMAMYRAKQKRNSFVMFDPNIDRPKHKQ
jgi:diguanylate cyclase (GGDEF)-like protein